MIGLSNGRGAGPWPTGRARAPSGGVVDESYGPARAREGACGK